MAPGQSDTARRYPGNAATRYHTSATPPTKPIQSGQRYSTTAPIAPTGHHAGATRALATDAAHATAMTRHAAGCVGPVTGNPVQVHEMIVPPSVAKVWMRCTSDPKPI